jgi:DNA-binding CsgD family transcriptional regulator
MRPQNYSTYISPYYADVLLLMRKHQDSAEVATQMDMSREAVAFAVAEIERKLDTVLFTRHCG